jgi:proliferating cell nuclear antigen
MNVVLKTQQKAECFSTIFQHIRLFTEHVNIMFEKERVYLQSMDSAKVSIFELYLPIDWFDIYEHTSETAVCIGISSSLLFKILNTREKGQETRLIYNVAECDKLFIDFKCEDPAVFDKSFEIPLIDLEHEIMAIPETDSQAEFSLSSVNFANIINQLKLFGDSLEIECSEEEILLYSLSQDAGKMQVKIDINELGEYSINEGENVKLSFSLAILHNVCMYSKISKNVNIYLKDNFPMKICFFLGDERSKLIFYVAPKISDDDS